MTGSLPGFYKLHPVNKQYSRRRCNVVLTRRPEWTAWQTHQVWAFLVHTAGRRTILPRTRNSRCTSYGPNHCACHNTIHLHNTTSHRKIACRDPNNKQTELTQLRSNSAMITFNAHVQPITTEFQLTSNGRTKAAEPYLSGYHSFGDTKIAAFYLIDAHVWYIYYTGVTHKCQKINHKPLNLKPPDLQHQ